MQIQPMEGAGKIDNEPLLPHSDGDDESSDIIPISTKSSVVLGEEDLPPIAGIRGFFSAFKDESKKLWYLAGPAVLTSICLYSLGAITQTFAGHVSTTELAGFSIENSVISGLCLGVTMGMGSALETLCGQAYGARQIDMLGVYMQRSWVILFVTSFLLMFMYIFAEPLLLLLGQTAEISRSAGRLVLWMIPQLYAYAAYFPISKFLQAQSDIMSMAWVSAAVLVAHVALSWLLMLKLGWGMAAGAAVLNASWWTLVVGQMAYILSGACGATWTGFSWKAFQNLWGFVRLSIASAVMLCLEVWYFTALILFSGFLKDAEVSVDALSICVNIVGWVAMVALGFNAAISVRVSNELGAGHPRTAKFSVLVVLIYSFLIALVVAILIFIFQGEYPSIFTDSAQVKEVVIDLTPLLAFCIVLNSIQPTLSGVAIGAGWQASVAFVNIGCYYLLGIPLGLIMGNVLHMGVKGIWSGMVIGTVIQTLILIVFVCRTNWQRETDIAVKRIEQWGGEVVTLENDLEE